MAIYSSYGNIRYPTPPQKRLNLKSFPNDLVAPGRNFYTELTFMTYDVSQQYTATARRIITGGCRLPIPKKLNDVQTLSWNEESPTAAAAGVLMGGLASSIGASIKGAAAAGGAIAGEALNPLLFMTFQKPGYKEHTLSWTLMPNSEQESRTIVDIVRYLKFNSLPQQHAGGLLYKYPNILFVRLMPNDIFTMVFKPCAVLSVSVDYTGAGTPSFFKNGAPTVVNLTLSLKEIQLWDQTTFDGQQGVSYRQDVADAASKAWQSVKDIYGNIAETINPRNGNQ